MSAGVFTYLRMNGPRQDQRISTAGTWVAVSCGECGAKKKVRRARAENGNPGECCGQVLTIESDE